MAMVKMLLVLILLAAATTAAGQDAHCPEFAESKGVLFRFSADDLYRKYGFQSFKDQPEALGGTVEYDRLAGKSAKVNPDSGPKDSILSSRYYAVIVEDCQRVFWQDINGRLEANDAMSSGITFLALPPTKWQVAEEVDRMSDARICTVTANADMPFPMFYFKRGRAIEAGIVGGDFPGRPQSFRVDKKSAIREVDGLSGARVQLLVSQIRAGGKKLLVGAYEWPYDTERVGEFNLSGLVEKLDHCKKWVSQ